MCKIKFDSTILFKEKDRVAGNKSFKMALLLFSFVMFSSIYAEDIMATASNGAIVILHDDGRWEFYKNNSEIRDIRPEAVPEDVKFNVSVSYENAEKIKKNVRLAMDAEFATEEEIKDSLRKVPKGGVIYFQVPTAQIKKGFVRELTYSIYDSGSRPIFTQTVADSLATPSELSDVSNLLVVPVYGKPKGKMLKARVENRKYNQTLEIDIPLQ